VFEHSTVTTDESQSHSHSSIQSTIHSDSESESATQPAQCNIVPIRQSSRRTVGSNERIDQISGPVFSVKPVTFLL